MNIGRCLVMCEPFITMNVKQLMPELNQTHSYSVNDMALAFALVISVPC